VQLESGAAEAEMRRSQWVHGIKTFRGEEAMAVTVPNPAR